ncbi:Hypothetical predicted protein [Xyrichtys novacula]|uniref:Uncharacterized protein n=1 Tax=Xyrichtys novacula TaxID=13765 RepID=A0AAV1G0Y3_XYRNO|nr:Hypothetical predicted protein [Xyrichtys novacula]
MAAVTQAASCCSVVTVMRTGSVYIDRLNDTGGQGGERRRNREGEKQMRRRGTAGFMQGVSWRPRRGEREEKKERKRRRDRSQLIGGLYSSDSLTGKVLS